MPDVLVNFSWELEFVDIDNEKLSQSTNNYNFEAMDVNSDDYLDVVTINDGLHFREHILLDDRLAVAVKGPGDISWPFFSLAKYRLFAESLEVGDAGFEPATSAV